MGKTIFKLEDVLEIIDVTPNQLAVKTSVRPNTIYNIKENKISRLNLDTLDKLLDGINDFSIEKGFEKKFEISDLMEYKKQP